MGLQELGREYQTLQMFQSRQSERRWESDKEVASCASCSKRFSVSVRRVGSTVIVELPYSGSNSQLNVFTNFTGCF